MKTPVSYIDSTSNHFFIHVTGLREVAGRGENSYLEEYVGPVTKEGKDFSTSRFLRKSEDLGLTVYSLVRDTEIRRFCEHQNAHPGEERYLWNGFYAALPTFFVRAGALLDVSLVVDERGCATPPRSMMDIARELQKRGMMWSGKMFHSVGGATGGVIFDWDNSWEEVQEAINQVRFDPDRCVQFDQL